MSSFEAGILVGCAAVVNAANPDHSESMPQVPSHATAATPRPPTEAVADMAAQCRAMTADHERMMTELDAAGRRLDVLVAQMDNKSGLDRTDETAAVVPEVVAQCLAMRTLMVRMAHGMTAHMMAHMQAGAGAMAPCPMMRPTGGTTH